MGLFFNRKKKKAVSYTLDESMEMPKKQENASQPDSVKEAPRADASNEVPAEIIAVIAAAVTVALGTGVRVLSVRRADSGRGRNAWSMAGLMDNTKPF